MIQAFSRFFCTFKQVLKFFSMKFDPNLTPAIKNNLYKALLLGVHRSYKTNQNLNYFK